MFNAAAGGPGSLADEYPGGPSFAAGLRFTIGRPARSVRPSGVTVTTRRPGSPPNTTPVP